MRKAAEGAEAMASLKAAWAEERAASQAAFRDDKQRADEARALELAAAAERGAAAVEAVEQR
jgi:hypothetical protein